MIFQVETAGDAQANWDEDEVKCKKVKKKTIIIIIMTHINKNT